MGIKALKCHSGGMVSDKYTSFSTSSSSSHSSGNSVTQLSPSPSQEHSQSRELSLPNPVLVGNEWVLVRIGAKIEKLVRNGRALWWHLYQQMTRDFHFETHWSPVDYGYCKDKLLHSRYCPFGFLGLWKILLCEGCHIKML